MTVAIKMCGVRRALPSLPSSSSFPSDSHSDLLRAAAYLGFNLVRRKQNEKSRKWERTKTKLPEAAAAAAHFE